MNTMWHKIHIWIHIWIQRSKTLLDQLIRMLIQKIFPNSYANSKKILWMTWSRRVFDLWIHIWIHKNHWIHIWIQWFLWIHIWIHRSKTLLDQVIQRIFFELAYELGKIFWISIRISWSRRVLDLWIHIWIHIWILCHMVFIHEFKNWH